ncbi:uncharacterized protein LOC125044813 [Penaeus chinensis]|uniref:uncharacterized protein LOC125044813 n=1 Tax=Penaeus chinensis TaxID=139456 RepID=UPI001FB82FBE|nr:uncharacterized protein LOC125044813 [Penaeus chinensis]
MNNQARKQETKMSSRNPRASRSTSASVGGGAASSSPSAVISRSLKTGCNTHQHHHLLLMFLALVITTTAISPAHGEALPLGISVVSVVETLIERTVALPCLATHHPHGDTPMLLLFYRHPSNIPFFSGPIRDVFTVEMNYVTLEMSRADIMSLVYKGATPLTYFSIRLMTLPHSTSTPATETRLRKRRHQSDVLKPVVTYRQLNPRSIILIHITDSGNRP